MASFHVERMAATPKGHAKGHAQQLAVAVRRAEAREPAAAAALRAQTFYVYPPGREFAGRLHQRTKAAEEAARLRRSSSSAAEACLVALTADPAVAGALAAGGEDRRALLLGPEEALVGTADVSLEPEPDQVLYPDHDRGRGGAGSRVPAFLSNLAVADEARRRGVAGALVAEARQAARGLGATDLYVVTLAINGKARALYEAAGFATVKEETWSDASKRGGCLDGVEGQARVVLLKDGRFAADVR